MRTKYPCMRQRSLSFLVSMAGWDQDRKGLDCLAGKVHGSLDPAVLDMLQARDVLTELSFAFSGKCVDETSKTKLVCAKTNIVCLASL